MKMNKTNLALNNAGITQITQKKKIRGKPFEKGNQASKGKPKGTVDFISQLKAAIIKLEKEKGISLIEFAIQKAYTNPQVLIAMLKKVIPDISQSDIKLVSFYEAYEKLTDQELVNQANAIINRTGTFNANKDIN